MEETDLFAAGYSPGFSTVLTSWQVFVARNRWLRQKVSVSDLESPYHHRVLWFWAKLSRQEMAHLQAIAERIKFQDFNRNYSHETCRITSCASYSVAVRFGTRRKEVGIYDMPRLAEMERHPAVIGCQELWDAITAHAPFEKVPIEQGLPRPWWHFWSW